MTTHIEPMRTRAPVRGAVILAAGCDDRLTGAGSGERAPLWADSTDRPRGPVSPVA